MKPGTLVLAASIASLSATHAADGFQKRGMDIGGAPRATPIDGYLADEARRQQAVAAAQRASADAAAARRNEAASIGVDARIVSFLQLRVREGSADAAYDLGIRYVKGHGVVADPKKAFRMMETAATRGNADAVKWLSTNQPPVEITSTNSVPLTPPAADR